MSRRQPRASGYFRTTYEEDHAFIQTRLEWWSLTALVAAINSWDDDAVSVLMADNIFLDESLESRRAAAAKIVAEHGELHIESIEIESGSMGIATVVGEKLGTKLLVDVMLTPHRQPLIQSYGFETVSLATAGHPLRDEA